MKIFKRIGFPLIIVLFLSIGPLIFFILNSPAKSESTAYHFRVNQGESVRVVAQNLRDAGLIRSDTLFISIARILDKTQEIKSGEYKIKPSLKTTEILDILSRGIVITQKFTVPEGLHIRQIAEILDKKGIVKSDDFIRASHDEELLKKFGIPFDSAEGFLFPDTYIVAKGLRAEQIVQIMIERFFESIGEIPFRDYTAEELERIVIIASLVEKEAKIDGERPVIAAVFYNRLSKKKRLESCATVQYVLGKTKDRLLFSDLKVNSPYNTYIHRGLPPGPIANPGINSLKAAIFPAEVDYLFFVSKKDGSHYFSTTYQEHLRAIKRYNRSGSIGHQIS